MLTLTQAVKANYLLKHNIDAMLKARNQHRKELAQWCRRSEAWMSKIFTDPNRGVPLKYLDRISDFFGVATYQLLQPGIGALTERRSKALRRSGRDRRVSVLHLGARAQMTVALEPEEIARLQRLRLLSEADRRKVDELLRELTPRLGRGGEGGATSRV
jgi:DNA-binding Xre family transcriptional regulator